MGYDTVWDYLCEIYICKYSDIQWNCIVYAQGQEEIVCAMGLAECSHKRCDLHVCSMCTNRKFIDLSCSVCIGKRMQDSQGISMPCTKNNIISKHNITI